MVFPQPGGPQKTSEGSKKTAEEIEDSVYDDKGQIKSRFTKEEWTQIIADAEITDFEVKPYVEDLTGRGDKTKSGKMEFLLLEIVFQK